MRKRGLEPRWPRGDQGISRVQLRRANVLGAGALRALPDGECDGILLAERVERGAGIATANPSSWLICCADVN
jgi:hypothetical protein